MPLTADAQVSLDERRTLLLDQRDVQVRIQLIGIMS